MTFQASSCDENEYVDRSESPLLASMDIQVPEIVDVHEEFDVVALFESVKQQNLNQLALILGKVSHYTYNLIIKTYELKKKTRIPSKNKQDILKVAD